MSRPYKKNLFFHSYQEAVINVPEKGRVNIYLDDTEGDVAMFYLDVEEAKAVMDTLCAAIAAAERDE